MNLMLSLSKGLVLIVPILLSVAFMTLMERKVLGLSGFRKGPNKISIQGILQPITDAVKLSNKQVNYLSNFCMLTYYLSSILMLMLALNLWSTYMWPTMGTNWKFSLMAIMLILSVSSMKSIMAGWSTFSKYSLLGSMRTVAQLISYESVVYLCILCFIWLTKSFNKTELTFQKTSMLMFIIPLVMFFWVPSMLAETSRTPYDFSEGESELVSGFNTEFGSKSFTLIFLSEYSNIIFFSLLTVFLFLMSLNHNLTMVIFMMMNFWIIWVRSTFPRLRFDKFMEKAWKLYIPFMTIILVVMMSMI